jgi:hypothetical protein
LPEKEIYTRDNVDKTFISIDMKQANFNCFLLISDVLEGNQEYVFRGKKSYKDYLHLFTPREYFKQSKYLRQVIFGNLNPKKQQQMQKYIMDYIVYVVRRKIDASKFFKSSADEIIIQSDSSEDKLEIKKCIDESFYNVKMFKLKQLGDKPYFVKEFDDSTIEFKCVPLHFFPQCYKYYHNLSITEKDRTFIFENNLAIFQESLFK